MKIIFNIYQYALPLIVFPLSYWLWWERFGRSHPYVLYILSIPVLTSYIIPALGTNVTGLWEFDVKLKLGKFRPHHGFMFGSAASFLAYLCLVPAAEVSGIAGLLRAGFILGSALAFWNWLYDIYAVRAGLIRVYNKQSFEKQPPEAIVSDYAPVYFGLFGFIYGVGIKAGEYAYLEGQGAGRLWLLAVVFNLLSLVVPVSVFALYSYRCNGHYGLSRYQPPAENKQG
ncbi:MAG: hypothetical protein Q7R35_05480 [Elusimicrobiota bacterium]|nr:hypothetical protein [Elusimicrobiota bacterium]